MANVIDAVKASHQSKLFAQIWSQYIVSRVGVEPIVATASGKSIAIMWKNGCSFAVTDTGELLIKVSFDRSKPKDAEPNFVRMNDLIASYEWAN